jgi:tRNA(Ile)-lysidine synthase
LPPARFHRFEAAVLDTVSRRRLFRSQPRVLVALSGGPDSTALVATLAALRDAGLLVDLRACHVDHRLRAGSAADGEFCEALCGRLGVPLERAAVTVASGENLQSAARRARYGALRAAARREGADHIATGHTRGDQAETVLHRLLRGSGARGLAAIPARRGIVIRPLLDRSREEVLSYLRDRGLGWREDPSNASARFLRNRIRAEIVPALEALIPGIERRLARTAELLREDDRVLERLAARAVPAGARCVDRAALLDLPAAVRRRALRRLWRSAAGSRRGLGADHVEAVMRHLRARDPKRITLPGGLEARVGHSWVEIDRCGEAGFQAQAPNGGGSRGGSHRCEALPPSRLSVGGVGGAAVAPPTRGLAARSAASPEIVQTRLGSGRRVEKGVKGESEPPSRLLVDGPGTYALPGCAGAVEIAWTSDEPAPWPLELRTRRSGDRFRPERGRGGKKLKAWLIDRKVPRTRRDALVLLADLEGHVLCMPELGACATGTAGLEVRWHAGDREQTDE